MLAVPRLAFASAAGVCDERGASSIAPPVVVKPLSDAGIGPHLPPEPALCELGSGLSCSCDEGRPLSPQVGDLSVVEALWVPAAVSRVKAPWVEFGWPAPASASKPPGWPHPIEHPPR